MPYDISTKKPDQQVPLLDSIFHEATDHPVRQSWLKNSNWATQCYEGDMWTPDEKKILEQRGQPDVVYNEIQAVAERLIGQFKRQRMAITFTGRNEPMDADLANVMSDLMRFVDQDTEYSFEEGDAVEDMLVTGFGVLEVGVENGPTGAPRIFTRRDDPHHIFPDPYCRRYDWNDPHGGARFIIRSKWVALEDAQTTWPEHANALQNAVDISPTSSTWQSTIDPPVASKAYTHYFDRQKRLVRPVEVWWKERVTKEVIVIPKKGVIAHYEEKEKARILRYIRGARVEKQKVDCMYYAVYAGNIIIKPATPSPYKSTYFPWIPIYAIRKKDGEPQGHLWRLIHPNREINARRSRAIYVLNNRQTYYEKGAIVSKDELAEQMANSDGQVEIQRGFFDKFQIRENQDIGQANLEMLQEAKAELSRLSGEDYLSAPSEMRSGKGVAQAQLPYHLSQVKLFDNIRRSRRIRARLVMDLIKQYYDDDMVFDITDDPDKVKTVTVSRGQLQTIRNRTFDVVLRDTTDYITTQQEQYETLTTTIPQVAQFGPGWGKILLMLSEVRDKDKILEALEAMEHPPATEPSVSVTIKWDELDAMEKASFAVKLGMPDLAKHEQQEGRRPARDDKHEADIAKTVIREGTRIGSTQSQQEIQAATEQMHGALESKKIELDERQQVVDQEAGVRESAQRDREIDNSEKESASE